MQIGILSRKPELYSTRRLQDAALLRGHDVRIVDYSRCYMDITSLKPRVMLRGQQVDVDAVVPRIGASFTFYGTALVRQFESMGVFCANGSRAISASRDKLGTLQLLAGRGIPLPVTGFARQTQDIDGLVDLVGGPPLIVKLVEGTQGLGVVLAETRKAAESVIAAFQQLSANILVQEFIAEAAGSDLRAFVIDDQVVAAMSRHAKEGEFRSNLHRGAMARRVELSDEERDLAVRAAQVLGLRVAGVDLLRSRRGPLVLEVNSSPGLGGIEAASGVDVADAIIAFVEEHALASQSQAS